MSSGCLAAWGSVSRYSGATVPGSHGVPALPTMFETLPRRSPRRIQRTPKRNHPTRRHRKRVLVKNLGVGVGVPRRGRRPRPKRWRTTALQDADATSLATCRVREVLERREAERHAAFRRTTRSGERMRIRRTKAVSSLRSATALQGAGATSVATCRVREVLECASPLALSSGRAVAPEVRIG